MREFEEMETKAICLVAAIAYTAVALFVMGLCGGIERGTIQLWF